MGYSSVFNYEQIDKTISWVGVKYSTLNKLIKLFHGQSSVFNYEQIDKTFSWLEFSVQL